MSTNPREDQVRIVREMLEPGAVALRVAERHEISTGLLFTWRRQMMAQVARPEFMPVQIEAASPLPSPASSPSFLSESLIEIELPGGARVRAGRGVDLKLLRGILTALDGR